MHPRFGKTTLQVLASSLLGLALVAGGASSILAQHTSTASAAKPATQAVRGGMSHAVVRSGSVNLATLPVSHTATTKPAPRANKTDRPLKTPAQLAAYQQYVQTHVGALPKATASVAPRATNMYGGSYLPVKQDGWCGAVLR